MANTGCSSSLRSSQFLFSSSLANAIGPDYGRAFQVRDRYLILPCIARNLSGGIIDDPSPYKVSGNDHEVCYCHSDRIGRRRVGKRAGKRARRRQSAAALHRASRSFGRAAICADRQLAGQSDPRDHAEERKPLHHDVTRPDAVARSAAAARPGVSSVVRSRQSKRSALGGPILIFPSLRTRPTPAFIHI